MHYCFKRAGVGDKGGGEGEREEEGGEGNTYLAVSTLDHGE